jgi:hypothetical protein
VHDGARLFERNWRELERHGVLTGAVKTSGEAGDRPATEFWLNAESGDGGLPLGPDADGRGRYQTDFGRLGAGRQGESGSLPRRRTRSRGGGGLLPNGQFAKEKSM